VGIFVWRTILLVGLVPLFAQAPENPNSQPLIRVTVDLVQVDAVVTDSQGNQVTNLRPEDFEILEDGHPQSITNFSYVRVAGPSSPETHGKTPSVPTSLPNIQPVQLRPEQVHRAVAVVVDDLHLSFENAVYVREALKAFVDKDIQPDDLVAVLRTSGSMGALQQFTNDKRLLEAAVEHIRYCLHCLSGTLDDSGPGERRILAPRESDAASKDVEAASKDLEAARGRESEVLAPTTGGTIDALEHVLRGLRDLPGRKAVIFVGEALPLCDRGPCSEADAWQRWRKLIDLALRSSVVVYTIDARGVPIRGLTAADVGGPETPGVQSPIMTNSLHYFESQEPMAQIADDTGGLFIHENNDLVGGMHKVMDDLKGYYLIGYKPPANTFEARKNRPGYHRIRLKVTRPGLQVRSRTGFYAIPEVETQPVQLTQDGRLQAALASPFGAGGLHLQLASQFVNEGRKESTAHLWLHIDAKDLTFREASDGTTMAAVDLFALTCGDNGEVVNSADQILTASFQPQQLDALRSEGLNYQIEIPIKEPGGYQLRVAVRDLASQQVGSASQFIAIPNLRSGKLVLSSIVLNEQGQGEKSPAIRRFQAGDRVTYRVEIYNARGSVNERPPKLEGSIQIIYEGRVVSKLNPEAIKALPEAPGRLVMLGAFTINRDTPSGDFLIQATVIDKLAPKRRSIAASWNDFEILPGSGQQ